MYRLVNANTMILVTSNPDSSAGICTCEAAGGSDLGAQSEGARA